MNKSPLLLIVLIGFFTFVVASCGKDPAPTPTPTAEFSCLVNGKPFTGVSFNTTLVSGESSPGAWGKRADIRATNASNDTTLILTFGEDPAVDSTFDCPPVNDSIVQDFYGSTATFIYMIIGNFSDGFPLDGGYTILSKCDEQDKLMDGTFECSSYSLANTADTFYYTNGVFKNIPYTLVK